MNKVIVSIFEKEDQAFEGLKALKSLHADGSISLYATSVVTKDEAGKAEIKQETDEGPVGTAIGMLTGGLMGMIAGPVGMLMGAGLGGMTGGIYDFSKADIDLAFLNEVADVLTPGKVAVLADVEETWTTPVDASMEKLGALIFRRNKKEVVDDQLARESDALYAELDELNAEWDEADDKMKASINKQIDHIKAKSKALNEATNKRMEQTKQEMDAKTEKLEAQIEKANKHRTKKLEKRLAELKEKQKEQKAKLEQVSKKLSNIVL